MKDQDTKSFYLIVTISLCFFGILYYVSQQIPDPTQWNKGLLDSNQSSYTVGCIEAGAQPDMCKQMARNYRSDMQKALGL